MNAIDYMWKDSLIKRQAQSEEKMLAEFETGDYTLEKPLVWYNPYLINPLSAAVLFRTGEETAVTVTVRGKTREADIKHTFPRAKAHILPILGLCSDYENRVELRLFCGPSTVITIRTPDVFEGRTLLYSMETTPEYMRDNLLFVTPAGEDLACGFDYAGDVRWTLSVPCIFDMKRLQNGHILIGTERLIRQPYYVSGLYEMDLIGKIYKEFCLPGGYHHDEIEMPDGNLLALTNDPQGDTVEDRCVLIDRESGEVLRLWDYKDFLDPVQGKSGSWSSEDWFHNNAVWYDPNSNSLTLSGRHIDGLVNIDCDCGTLNWILGDPKGWEREWVDRYFFTPQGEPFLWQYEQHGCLITPDGDVMCFDNHHYGSKDSKHFAAAKDSFSRGVRYRLNRKERTIRQVWEYGRERGTDFFSPYISNVDYYGEGHYMIHSGGIAYLHGEPSDTLGTYVKSMEDGRLETRTVEVINGRVMMELHLPGNYYRGKKLRLYTEGGNLDTGAGKRLGRLGVTKEFGTDILLDNSNELLPGRYQARVEEEEDLFTFYARFEKGQLVMLLLEQGEERRRYFISTTAVRHTAMCCGIFLDSDERKTRTTISKTGLSGSYDLRIIVDEMKYETGVSITAK